MTEYNLTLGQAIDTVLSGGKVVIENDDNVFYMAISEYNKIAFLSKRSDNYHGVVDINAYLNAKFAVYETKSKTKLITWYRAKAIMYANNEYPLIGTRFYKEKEIGDKNIKVLNDDWEEIQAPENFKDW